jgi:hypothetical protein
MIEGNISTNDNFSRENSDLIDVYMTSPNATWGKHSLDADPINKIFISLEEIAEYIKLEKGKSGKFGLYCILTMSIHDVHSFTEDQIIKFARGINNDPINFQKSAYYNCLPKKTTYILKGCFITK